MVGLLTLIACGPLPRASAYCSIFVRAPGVEPALLAISGRRLLALGYMRVHGGWWTDRTSATLRPASR